MFHRWTHHIATTVNETYCDNLELLRRLRLCWMCTVRLCKVRACHHPFQPSTNGTLFSRSVNCYCLFEALLFSYLTISCLVCNRVLRTFLVLCIKFSGCSLMIRKQNNRCPQQYLQLLSQHIRRKQPPNTPLGSSHMKSIQFRPTLPLRHFRRVKCASTFPRINLKKKISRSSFLIPEKFGHTKGSYNCSSH